MIYVNDYSERFQSELSRICKASPYGARIESYYNAYIKQRYSFVEFWLCSEEGSTTSAFCRYYSTVIFCGKGNEEAASFIEMLSPQCVFCDRAAFNDLPFMKVKYGETMVFSPQSQVIASPLDRSLSIERSQGDMKSLKDVYSLLLNAFPERSVAPFDEFFIDNSHLIRHEASDVYFVYHDEELVSTLTVTAVSQNAAVIGNIATLSEYRGRGIAGALISDVCSRLNDSNRHVYLHRREPISLYEKCGFETIGEWAEYSNYH